MYFQDSNKNSTERKDTELDTNTLPVRWPRQHWLLEQIPRFYKLGERKIFTKQVYDTCAIFLNKYTIGLEQVQYLTHNTYEMKKADKRS